MIGQTIAHYRITAKLGEGGMGAVYRATDTKLGRDVAVKVLPDSFAQDHPDRMARFQREAQVLASLNHPNIAAIYGVEDRALIMELVEGEDLAGPVPVDKAIDYAHQIADALSAAHDKGIIHRDLKPANIKITLDGVVKVLDFGLAKATDLTKLDTTIDPVNSPTVVAGTMAGVIMGTAAYMAPEQARGQAVDKRADIWAFGVVLFEMLTGKPLFNGETVSDTLASVMKDEIDFSKLPKNTPPSIKLLLQRCLQRDRKNRLRDLGDAWVESPAPPSPQRTNARPWMFLSVLMTLLFALTLWSPWKKPTTLPLLHFDIDTGDDGVQQMAVSPDGLRVAFISAGRLLVRRLDQQTAITLPGTEGASYPFFSPDSRWTAFFAGGKLRKMTVEGGAAIALCDAPSGRGGSWGTDGNIVAALNSFGGLTSVPVSGGSPKPVTDVKRDVAPIQSHRWPQVLPGNRGVLFAAWDGSRAFIRVLPPSGGEPKTVVDPATTARYLPTGHLIYHQQGSLYAAPFDLNRLELTGPSTPLVTGVAMAPVSGFGGFDISETGTLVYKRRIATPQIVSWLHPSGATEPLPLKPGRYSGPRLSPDGKRLALGMEQDGNVNIAVYEMARDLITRITFDAGNRVVPVWSADGEFLAFSDGGVGGALAWSRSEGGSKVERFNGSEGLPSSFSPDGKWLVFQRTSQESARDPWVAPVERVQRAMRVGAARPLFIEKGFQLNGAVSPDGRWLAYTSDESGRMEVYVVPFSPNGTLPSGKWQISEGGGSFAAWSRTSRELFFANPDRRIMSAAYTTAGETFVPAKSRQWSARQLSDAGNYSVFDVAPDGKRVVAILDETDEKTDAHLRVVLNLDHELRRKGGSK
jgi:serine/threonine protein kinase